MPSPPPRLRNRSLAVLLLCLLPLAATSATAQQSGDGTLRLDRSGGETLVSGTTPDGRGFAGAPATLDFGTLGTFTLGAGASVTLEFDVMVNPAIPAGVSMVANQGSVSFDQAPMALPTDDPTTRRAGDPTVTLLLVEAELGVTKTDNPASATAVPGNAIQYDVVVSNAGPFGVLDVPVTDTFPASLTGCSWACGGTGNCDAANGMGDIATTVDLMAGQSVTFVISCTVDPSATGMLANTASATTPMGVSDPGNVPNSATDTNTLTPQGDLSVTKVTNTSPVVAGSAIQYTVTVANSGPSDAVGVDVTDNLPASITGVSWTCAGADCPNANGMGDIAETANLGAGNNIVYTVNGTVDAGAVGSISNTASLAVPAGFTDTTPGNESDTVMDSLNAEGDVAVAKTTLTSPVVPGAAVQWQIAVTNPGPSDALGVTLADSFPATVSGVTWTCAASAGSACSAAMGAGNLNESLNVAAGGNVTYTATGTVDANATGNLVNTASVTPPMGFTDGSTGNDDSTTMDALVPQGNLSITKSTLTSPVVAGNPVQYQIVVANSGPSTAVGAMVQDNFAAALANESWTCVASAGSSCTAAGMGDVLDMVTLLPSGTATYTVSADVSPMASGMLINVATVTAPAGYTDTNGGDNSFQVMDAVLLQADLVVSKDDGGGLVLPGGPVTYTIVVTNLGPSDVTGVTVTDVFPAGFSNVSWTCVAAGGATCTAGPVMGDVNDLVDLPSGGSVTYTANADAPNTPGPVTNTASAALPAGAMDPTPDDATAEVTTSIGSILDVPTLSPAGLAVLVLLLVGLGVGMLRRGGRGAGGAAAGLALLLAFGLAGAADAQVVVDDFSTLQGPNTDPPGGPPPAGSTADGAGILGGERDLVMARLSGAGTVTGAVAGGAFDFVAPPATRGEAEITWDGDDDDESTLDPVGLGGVDLTASGTQSGFALLFDTADADLEIILRVYTDGGNYSQAGRLVTTSIVAPTTVFIPFGELRTVAGSGADPTNVGAIVLVLRGDDAVSASLADLSTGGPNLTIAKVDLDPNTNTEIGNTPVAAGSTIRYRITLQNSGGDATTVDVNDMAPANTSLLPNTLNSTPVAVGDAYNWFGNVTLTVAGGALPTLLANDTDPDGDPITITAFDAMTPQGGTVSMVNVMTGAFTYLPPAGFNGIDSFTYTIEDDDGNAATATATILLEQSVWFVDSDQCAVGALPCGTGTQADPFGSLIQAEVASGPGDVIRLRQGAADATHHNQGIVLKPSQRLIGQGVDLVLGGIVIEGVDADPDLDPTPANRPSITNASMGGEGLTLASGVTVLGLNVVGTADSAVFGAGVDAVTVDHVAVVDSGGAALEVTNGTNLSLTFTGLDSLTSIEDALLLDAVTGSLTVSGTTQLDNPAGAGIRIINSPGFTASFAAVNVVDAGGGMPHPALQLTSNAGATFTFGALNLDSENGPGLLALNGGTVSHPSSGNVINAVGGAAVDIQSTTGSAGGSPGWSFDSLTSASSPNTGVRLVSLAQDFNVGMGGTTITNPDTTGILVQNSGANTDYDFGATSVTDTNVGMGATANGIDIATGNSMATFTFDSLSVVTDGGFGLLANNSGTIAIGGTTNTIVANGGPALDLTSTTVDQVLGGAVTGITFSTLSSSNTAGDGLNLDAVVGGVTGNGGTITNSGGIAVDVNAHGGPFTYNGSIDNNGGRSVEITNSGGTSANVLAFGGLVDDTGSGIFLDNNDQNAGATINFTGGLTLSTGTNAAFTATNGGTVNATQNNTTILNTAATTTGVAVTVTNTTLGASGVTFRSVAANGAPSGIVLSNAGTGGFNVVGNGAAGAGITANNDTGGSILNTTGDGVQLTNLSNVSLAYMRIQDAADHGIDANAVTNFTLSRSNLVSNGNANLEHGLNMLNPAGTATVANVLGDGSFDAHLRVFNQTGNNLTLFRVMDSTLQNVTTGFYEDGISFEAQTGVTTAIEVTGSTFANHDGDHVQVSTNGATDATVTITGNTMTGTAANLGAGITVNSADTYSGTTNFLISGNSLQKGNDGSTSINVNIGLSNASGSYVGTISNNVIGTLGTADSAGDTGIMVQVNRDATMTVAITGNTIREFDNNGITLSSVDGVGVLNATVTGNTVTSADSNAFAAVFGDGQSNNTLCADIGDDTGSTPALGNTMSASAGFTDVAFQTGGTGTINLEGYGGAADNQPAIQTYIQGRNTGTPGVQLNPGGNAIQGGGACPTP